MIRTRSNNLSCNSFSLSKQRTQNQFKFQTNTNFYSKPITRSFSSNRVNFKHNQRARSIPRSEEVADIRNLFKDFDITKVEDPLSVVPTKRQHQEELLKKVYEYSDIATKTGKSEDIELAIDTYQQLKVKFDQRVFGAILRMCGANGMVGEAVDVYHDILHRKLKPNYTIFKHLFEAALSGHNIPRGMYFFKEMENRVPGFGHSPRAKEKAVAAILPLLKLCYKAGRPDRAAVVVAEMWRHRLYRPKTIKQCKPNFVWKSLIDQVTPNDAEANRFKYEVDCYMNSSTPK